MPTLLPPDPSHRRSLLIDAAALATGDREPDPALEVIELLDTPTHPMPYDHDASYAALVAALPNLELEADEAARLRAMTRGDER